VTPLTPALSDREELVLLMLADGHGLREIADRLGVSGRVVRRDRDRARCKLEASTTTHAVAIVVRLRLEVGVA
jgi:DNA-binding CsgD family transcriptional regulator